MKTIFLSFLAPLRLCAFALILLGSTTVSFTQESSRYEVRPAEDPNGIAKYYMGRQIAHVMGHQAADWLERPEREQEEQTEKMVESLHLKSGDNVADIGAGTGYISWRMAKKVAPTGKVYAVEIQQEMLDLLSENMKKRGITNVVQTLGTITDPKLPPNALDLIIMVDVYHEFDHPYEMTEAMVRSLKPGGRLVFVEFRKEDRSVPIKELHKMSVAQVKKEMSVHPLEYSETITNLPWQHVIIFKKLQKPRAEIEQLPALRRDSVDFVPAPAVRSVSKERVRVRVENTVVNSFSGQ
jgi:ubiquinone/menaquinone biosynthesis C-methylase UbiE